MTYVDLHQYRFENNPNDSIGTTNAVWKYNWAIKYSNTIYAEGSYSAGTFLDWQYLEVDKSVLTGLGQKGKISAYIYHTSQSHNSMVLSWRHSGTGYYGYINWNLSGALSFVIDGKDINTPEFLKLNKWYFIECTWGDAVMKIFVDGTEKASGPQYGKTMSDVDANVYIGKYAALGNFNWMGYIDDLRFSGPEYFSSAPAIKEGFSLAWKPFIADESHYEPHLSEKPNIQSGGEIYERSVLQKSNGTEAGTTLNPLMPDVKRNKENNLAQFLEGETLLNLTKLRGTEESKRPGNWKESNKQKDY